MKQRNEASNVIQARKDTHPMELAWRQYRKLPIVVMATRMDIPFSVHTPSGIVAGEPGDWLIEGVNGEMYPCRDEIFQQTYELVTEGETA